MAWKSRQERLPPPSYFALIVEHLQRSYRGARISRELMQALRPFFIDAWRRGVTAEAAAGQTCSCDGREIVPSPAVGVFVARGEVRPPRGAERGEVFGADDLRPPAAVERLEKKLHQIEKRQKKELSITTRWQHREQSARKDFVKAEAQQRIGAATQRYAGLRDEAQRIEAELRRVRSDLNRAERAPRLATEAPVAPTRETAAKHAAPAQREAAPPAKQPVVEAPRVVKKRRKAASEDAQAAAMLASIRGLLPEVAGQLAAQMKKEGGQS
jgi:hypothetical protein